MTIHVSLDKVNLNTINVSITNFSIWQDYGSNWTTAHMQMFMVMPEIPITQLYKHMIGHS